MSENDYKVVINCKLHRLLLRSKAECLALSDLISLPRENESLKSIKSYKVRYKVKADEKLIHRLPYFKTERWQK